MFRETGRLFGVRHFSAQFRSYEFSCDVKCRGLSSINECITRYVSSILIGVIANKNNEKHNYSEAFAWDSHEL